MNNLSKLSELDLDTLDSALLDAIEFIRDQQEETPESSAKKESYIKLYNKLFMSDTKGR